MDLKRLNHLIALAEERNFGRAAQRVHLSQPAFSRSIQSLEAELGLQLFDRGTLEATCTAAGSFVVERARKLLFDSRNLERDVRLYRERLLGDIAFGTGPFPAVTMVPQLLIELRRSYPGINTRVEVNNWNYLLQHLRAEELDFFLADVRDVPPDADLSVISVGQLQGRFYVRAGHPLLKKKSIQASAMVPFGLASVRRPVEIGSALRQLLELGPDEAQPVALECDDVRLLKQVVLASDLVLGSIDLAVRDEVEQGRLVALPLRNGPPLYNDMGLVSLKGRSFSPVAQFAADFLRQGDQAST